MRLKVGPVVLFAIVLFALSGCIWDAILGDDVEEGAVTLSITDAPVDEVARVRLSVAAVELVSDDRGTERFDFSGGITVSNLLDLRSGNTQRLLQDEELPAARYQSLRLYINGGNGDSLVEERAGGEFELFTPGQSPGGSGEEYLQVDGDFRVEEGETTAVVLDVDLRRGLWKNINDNHYWLIGALRLMEEGDTGDIAGTVDSGLLQDGSCTNDLAEDRGHAVYVYNGAGATIGDIFLDDSGAALNATSPLTAVPVIQDADTGDYEYRLPFLPAGDYTLALTCQALNDDPALQDNIGFLALANGTVTAGDTATVDF